MNLPALLLKERELLNFTFFTDEIVFPVHARILLHYFTMDLFALLIKDERFMKFPNNALKNLPAFPYKNENYEITSLFLSWTCLPCPYNKELWND